MSSVPAKATNGPGKGVEVRAFQDSLREALFDGVTPADAKEIVQGVVKRAKAGDPAAVKMFFEYVLGGAAPKQAVQNNYYPPPAEPTKTRPGGKSRLAVYADRAARGEELNHDDDES